MKEKLVAILIAASLGFSSSTLVAGKRVNWPAVGCTSCWAVTFGVPITLIILGAVQVARPSCKVPDCKTDDTYCCRFDPDSRVGANCSRVDATFFDQNCASTNAGCESGGLTQTWACRSVENSTVVPARYISAPMRDVSDIGSGDKSVWTFAIIVSSIWLVLDLVFAGAAAEMGEPSPCGAEYCLKSEDTVPDSETGG